MREASVARQLAPEAPQRGAGVAALATALPQGPVQAWAPGSMGRIPALQLPPGRRPARVRVSPSARLALALAPVRRWEAACRALSATTPRRRRRERRQQPPRRPPCPAVAAPSTSKDRPQHVPRSLQPWGVRWSAAGRMRRFDSPNVRIRMDETTAGCPAPGRRRSELRRSIRWRGDPFPRGVHCRCASAPRMSRAKRSSAP